MLQLMPKADLLDVEYIYYSDCQLSYELFKTQFNVISIRKCESKLNQFVRQFDKNGNHVVRLDVTVYSPSTFSLFCIFIIIN